MGSLVGFQRTPDVVRPGGSIQRNAGILEKLATAIAQPKEGFGARKSVSHQKAPMRVFRCGSKKMTELQPPLVLGDKVWCQRCREYVKVIRVANAAKIVDVDRRTVYNYIKKNKVFAVKVA